MSVEFGSQEETFVVFEENVVIYMQDLCKAMYSYMETDPNHAALLSCLAFRELRERLENGTDFKGDQLYTT